MSRRSPVIYRWPEFHLTREQQTESPKHEGSALGATTGRGVFWAVGIIRLAQQQSSAPQKPVSH